MKKILCILTLPLLLWGCANHMTISKEDAEEICLDAAGYTKDDVQNLNVQEGDVFTVTFKSDGGDYEYQVQQNGIIKKRHVKSHSSLDEEDVIEKPVKEEEEEVDENDLDEETEEAAIQTALTNLALKLNQVNDLEVTKTDDEKISVKLTVIANGNKFETIIDPNTGRAVSSYIV
ncbi:MAG: hypothetical protein Q4C49_11045 [Bacillota bacterium]|nr:hypothetical protein [Bacillota bacterium]